jgi:hypothetical protein
MITINTVYDLHKVEIDLEVEQLSKDIKDLQPLYFNSLVYFKSVEHKLSIPISIEDIKNNKQPFIPHAVFEKTVLPLLASEKYFNLKLNNFMQINKEYRYKLRRKEELMKSKLPKNVVSFIITRFNELLVEEILYNKYEFYHNTVGRLKLHLHKNKIPVVNWGISLRNKKKLEEKGRIPFIKADETLALKEGKEYKGEHWLSYCSLYSFYLNWSKGAEHFIKIPNIGNYSFVPYRGVNSPVSKINDYRKTYSEEAITDLYYSKYDN